MAMTPSARPSMCTTIPVWPGGVRSPSEPLHTQLGFAAVSGWNRLLFNTPQPFPKGEERGIVLKIVNNTNTDTIAIDYYGADSGRSYIDDNGEGNFAPLGFDLNIVALLSGTDNDAPTASAINPATAGPTHAEILHSPKRGPDTFYGTRTPAILILESGCPRFFALFSRAFFDGQSTTG